MVSITWLSVLSEDEEGIRYFPLEHIEKYSHQFYILKGRLGLERISSVKKRLEDACASFPTGYYSLVKSMGKVAVSLEARLEEICKEESSNDESYGIKWSLVSMGMERYDSRSWWLPSCWSALNGNQPIFIVKIDILPAELLQENQGSRRTLNIATSLPTHTTSTSTKTTSNAPTKQQQAQQQAQQRTQQRTQQQQQSLTGSAQTKLEKEKGNQQQQQRSVTYAVFCTQCGEKALQNAKFCHSCGRSLAYEITSS
mmetsp:Transcript_3359/g.3992  ORF Transcript_3359/g.3992 Transcript_3359/m.3992 type:complete len:255 (+) Transcript_3359:96-860(+)